MATAVASQSKTEPDTIEQERPWTAGSVWTVDFIRVKSGHGLEYWRELAATWKTTLEENKKQGLVLSYKILFGVPSNREDFTHMLMIEHPNWATFDQQDKVDATMKKVFGSLGGVQETFRKREEIREAIGTRLLREYHFK
jgi:hypothetical protein